MIRVSLMIRVVCLLTSVLPLSALLLALGSPGQAQITKLAGPFAPGPGGGAAREVCVSPDGTHVAYRADQDDFEVFELYSAPADGSAPAVKLSGSLPENGDVSEGGFRFSPDGARILYLADQDADDVIELWSVPSDGSAAPVKLNGALTLGGDVGTSSGGGYEFSADGTRVVYRADQEVDGQLGLWSVPVDGSAAPVKISGSAFSVVESPIQIAADDRVLFTGFNVTDGFEILSAPLDGSSAPLVLTQFAGNTTTGVAAIPPDGSRALVLSAQSSPQDQRLWSAPVDGSAPPTLLTPTVIKMIGDMRISPDGTRAIYLGSLSGAFEFELFSVPLDASASPVRLHTALPAGRSVLVQKNGITSDSARALFIADISADDVFELWSAPLDGSASAVKLNDVLAPGKDVTGVFGTTLVAASERVVFQVSGEVFSAPADGSGPALKLNAALASGQSVSPYSNDLENPSQPFGADNTRVVFALSTHDGFEDFLVELYSVPIDASAAPAKLNGTLVPGGDVVPTLGWRFAASRVLFFADKDTDDVIELYSAPIDAGPGLVKLNGTLSSSPPGSLFSLLSFTPDGTRALYRFRLEGQTQDDLYSVPTDASAAPVRLHPALPQDHLILRYAVSPDGSRVVFVDFDGGTFGGGVDLYSAPTDGSGPAVAFDAATNSGFYALTPDGAHVITRGQDERLYRAPIDASAPGVALTSAMPAAQYIRKFVLTPDGSKVVFVQDRDTPGVLELYCVPVDGSAPPLKLNPPLVANGDVGWLGADTIVLLVSPDSTRVVYLADQELDERRELYSVPLAGGPATKLSGSLVTGGDVIVTSSAVPALSPDGTRVVYVADKLVDDRNELFSVPILGGPSVKLNGTLVANGDVDSTRLSIDANSQRVVYRADAAVDEQYELYSVPLTGGAVTRLNGDLVLHGDVLSFELAPDGSRVVYVADQELDARPELHSRRLDGGGQAVRLNAPLPVGGAILSARISADSRRVVYFADQEADQRFELFKVPLAGGPIQRLNAPLVMGGDVGDFALSADGSLLVYSADQDTNDMTELFARALDGGGPGPRKGAASSPAGSATVGPLDVP